MDIQTLQANTLPNITGVINPRATYPGKGLLSPVIGQRYLLLDSIPPGHAWGGITAKAWQIVEYRSEGWVIAFDATTNEEQYLVNTKTSQQLAWNGSEWHLSVDGNYAPGYWRLAL
jgi:hypothetical protein